MDKYEYKLKLDQLKNLVAAHDYMTAAEIADSINWKKVRNSKTLCMVGKIYERLGRYNDSREVLLQAYDHSPIGRNIVYCLAENAIKAKKTDDAEEYYNEFLEIAPNDIQRYVLSYKLNTMKKAPLTDRIAILEELKGKEYLEEWAYELAYLYYLQGMREKCVEACDELVLWFGDGEFVEKALELKRYYQPLSPSQEEKYKQLRQKKGAPEQAFADAEPADAPKEEAEDKPQEKVAAAEEPSLMDNVSTFNTTNLQEELARSMRQIMNATEKETVCSTMDSIKKMVGDVPYLSGKGQEPMENIPTCTSSEDDIEQGLKVEFQNMLREDNDGQMNLNVPDAKVPERQVSGQMSIEDILSEWEKTKRAAETAIAAAEQKKLARAKEQALKEAGDIMQRLKDIIPILSEEIVPEHIHAKEPEVEVSDEGQEPKASQEPETEMAIEPKTAESEAAEPEVTEPEATEPETAEPEDAEPETKLEADDAQTGIESVPVTEEEPELEEPAEEDVVSYEEENAQDAGGSGEGQQEEPAVEEMAEDTDSELAETEGSMPEEEAVDNQAEEVAKPEYRIPSAEEDRELENYMKQATQVMMRNANVEVPVQKPNAPSDEADFLSVSVPDSLAPENIEETEHLLKLTKDQKELFSYFLPVPGMEEQISQIIMGVSERAANSITSITGNILIQGEEGSGKTVLATSLIKVIQQMAGNEDAKIGKISAASLNQKDFATLIPRIAGGFLIVDKAGDLLPETAARMSQLMEQNTQGLIVVLEDTKAGIRKAMSLDYGFAKKFTEKINIPIFTIDELVSFGKSYAEEMECTIDEMGVLALYNRINNIQKLERPTTLAEVKEIVDEAIERAETGGLKKFFTKKYNDNDYLILREKDFDN